MILPRQLPGMNPAQESHNKMIRMDQLWSCIQTLEMNIAMHTEIFMEQNVVVAKYAITLLSAPACRRSVDKRIRQINIFWRLIYFLFCPVCTKKFRLILLWLNLENYFVCITINNRISDLILNLVIILGINRPYTLPFKNE